MADSPTRATDKPEEASDLKRKLVMRVGFAGLMIVLLLATLAVFDRMNAPEETAPAEPRFTEPVPVGRKEVAQAVTPAEPAPEGEKVAPAAEPEASAAPVDKSVAPSGPPPRPAVRVESAAPAPAAHAAPRPEAAARPAPQSVATPGVRLFSGYALQAGVFSDTHRAEELHAKLTLNGIPSTIESRVQVGPFKTREEAEAARAKMKALGIDALLLPPPKAASRR